MNLNLEETWAKAAQGPYLTQGATFIVKKKGTTFYIHACEVKQVIAHRSFFELMITMKYAPIYEFL